MCFFFFVNVVLCFLCEANILRVMYLSLFQEKQILQKAHGQQELAVSAVNGINQEAKRCVDMWLKMPGNY